jgi:hypothetical protein
MANPLDANELIKQGQTRTFYQPGGPGTEMYFFGLDTSYHFIDSAEMAGNGTIDPVFVPDPRRPNRYRLVARQIGAPDLPSVSLVFHEQWGGIPRALMSPKCEFNLYEVHSRCADLSDFYRGWDSYVLVYSGFRFESGIDLGARTAADSDEGLTANIDAKGAAIYPVGALGFGEEATLSTNSIVYDVVYGTSITCAECGVSNDGSQFIYSLAGPNPSASPSFVTSRVIYTVDGGVNWVTAGLGGTVGTDVPQFIDIAGSILYCGIQVGTDTKIYYASIDPLTGAPGAFSVYTVSGVIRDTWVKSPRSIWFSGTAGRIWKTSDIMATPTIIDNGAGSSTTLSRIHGANDVIVAVGGNPSPAATAIRYSKNGGATWTTITDVTLNGFSGITVGNQAKSIFVVDNNIWYVGLSTTLTTDNNIVKTITGGQTWKPVTFSESTDYSVDDIVFPTREVCWLVVNTGSEGHLFTSIDGASTFARYDVTSRISGYPASSVDTINRIGCPLTAEPAVAANYVALAGESTVGAADLGILITAAPTIV